MMKKKIISLMSVLMLLASMPLVVYGKEWIPNKEEFADFTVEMPDDVHIFTEETAVTSPEWAFAGIEDPTEITRAFSDDQQKGGMSSMACIVFNGGSTWTFISARTSSESREIHNFSDITEDERQAFADQYKEGATEDMVVETGLFDNGSVPFFKVYIDADLKETDTYMQGDSGEKIEKFYELIYGTVINGYKVDFDMVSKGTEIPEEEIETLEGIIRSFKITNLLTKEEVNNVDISEILPAIIILSVITLFIIGSIVFVRMRNKRDKKNKKIMAERLSEYHKDMKVGKISEGELRFSNITECDNEALGKFSRYHAYVKNLPPMLFGIIISVFLLVVTLLTKAEWYIILIAAALIVYYGYKAITSANNVERVQRKIYSVGNTRSAKYVFYDNVFRVSGVQSGSLYPYFQLTDIGVTKEYIYLYYGPDNAYIIDINGFKTGSAEEFLTFIKKKVNKNG